MVTATPWDNGSGVRKSSVGREKSDQKQKSTVGRELNRAKEKI